MENELTDGLNLHHDSRPEGPEMYFSNIGYFESLRDALKESGAAGYKIASVDAPNATVKYRLKFTHDEIILKEKSRTTQRVYRLDFHTARTSLNGIEDARYTDELVQKIQDLQALVESGDATGEAL